MEGDKKSPISSVTYNLAGGNGKSNRSNARGDDKDSNMNEDTIVSISSHYTTTPKC